jgi:hypothetical protein
LVGRASNHNTQNEEPYIKQSLSEFIWRYITKDQKI